MKTTILPVDARKIGRIRAVPSPQEDDLLDDLAIDLDEHSEDAEHLRLAAELLKHSDIPVAFPTETVYGLGADATRSEAVRGIYRAKQRPVDNPLIVHFASLGQLRDLLRPHGPVENGASTNGDASDASHDDPIPTIYHPLISKFWPGPLTIILPNPPHSLLAPEVTAGLPTFGARIPANLLALALIKLADVPVAAPSANASTKPSPTAAEHVAFDLNGRIATILDGGPCDVGVESTVVDGLSHPPLILRPGGVSAEELRSCAGWEGVRVGYKNAAETTGSQPRAPGMKYRHYSPRAPVVLFEAGVRAPGLEEMRGYVGGNGRLGVIRTRCWGIDAGSDGTPITTRQAEKTFYTSTRQVGAGGFAGLLTTLHASSEPKKAITTHHFLARGSPIELLDLGLGPDTAGIARGVFAALRELDRYDVDAILVEGIDETEGTTAAAVMNRLLLVTGFGPFQQRYPVNPSYEITRLLPPFLPQATTADGNPVQIIGYGSPIRVCYADARELIPPLLEAYSKTVDFVLHIGMASGRQYYAAERYAHRDGYSKHKDLDGCFPSADQTERDFGDCPELLETSLDYDSVLHRWQAFISQSPETSPAWGADCRPSENAGNFLCDYTYFNCMAWYGRRNKKLEGGSSSDRPVMFLHVPAESDEAALEKGAAVASALIQAMVDDFLAPRAA
ncbi:hypothetical protein B0A55_05222 [Friedmanniomyces simplex]|uniref:Threonylcarbamoyl-AMP synthase n=1 Tax=Friedmanniomyces simplex TaxID=329884 RepID=A0A4U0XD40_9PEZI|nr:hypothetical protein B0A55_05222 [Friedmanniomyces simplex]